MNIGSKPTEGWFRTELHHPDPGGHLLKVVAIGFLFVAGKGLEIWKPRRALKAAYG